MGFIVQRVAIARPAPTADTWYGTARCAGTRGPAEGRIDGLLSALRCRSYDPAATVSVGTFCLGSGGVKRRLRSGLLRQGVRGWKGCGSFRALTPFCFPGVAEDNSHSGEPHDARARVVRGELQAAQVAEVRYD
jgi:hypothetical protein